MVWSRGGTCFEQEDGGVMLHVLSVHYTIHICGILVQLSLYLYKFKFKLDGLPSVGSTQCNRLCSCVTLLSCHAEPNHRLTWMSVSPFSTEGACCLLECAYPQTPTAQWAGRVEWKGLPLKLLLHSHQPYLLHISHQLCCPKNINCLSRQSFLKCTGIHI